MRHLVVKIPKISSTVETSTDDICLQGIACLHNTTSLLLESLVNAKADNITNGLKKAPPHNIMKGMNI